MSKAKVTATILGVARLQGRVGRIKAQARGGVANAINTIAAEVFTASQHRVPVDTGTLKGSGRVHAATDRNLSAALSYGGPASGYALPVHETHRTGSKYLEGPAREAAGKFKEEMTAAIRAAKKGI